MIRLMRYLLAAGAFALTSLAGSALAQSTALKGFQTPSHNIVCGGTNGSPAWLRCDITSGLKPKPARPKGCVFDYGVTLTLSAKGSAQIGCVSDAVLPDPSKAPVLAYGKTWRYGPFTCGSAKTGLTCRNKAHHGFFLSRERWKRL
jgi:hypothetical protein